MQVTSGATNVITYFMMRSSTNGTAASGLSPTTFDLQYTRTGEAPVSKIDAVALSAVDAAHLDNGVIEVDGTNSPGLYRVDWPDAAFIAGAAQVFLSLNYSSAVFTEVLAVDIEPAVEGTLTINQVFQILLAESSGKLLRSGNTISIRNQADTADVITATVDGTGQRTSVTVNPT